jgi:hypothetical protein
MCGMPCSVIRTVAEYVGLRLGAADAAAGAALAGATTGAATALAPDGEETDIQSGTRETAATRAVRR